MPEAYLLVILFGLLSLLLGVLTRRMIFLWLSVLVVAVGAVGVIVDVYQGHERGTFTVIEIKTEEDRYLIRASEAGVEGDPRILEVKKSRSPLPPFLNPGDVIEVTSYRGLVAGFLHEVRLVKKAETPGK